MVLSKECQKGGEKKQPIFWGNLKNKIYFEKEREYEEDLFSNL